MDCNCLRRSPRLGLVSLCDRESQNLPGIVSCIHLPTTEPQNRTPSETHGAALHPTNRVLGVKTSIIVFIVPSVDIYIATRLESSRARRGDDQGRLLQADRADEEVDHTLWGELESESEESESESEESDQEEAAEESGLVTPAEGLMTPSGVSSVPAGMETPEMIELRKRKIESEMEG